MSLIQIPNLPAVVGLDGTELFEGVQAGTSVKISLAQMIAATRSGLPTTLPIPVSLGGTGVTTLTGYVKGSGTSPFTASPTIPNTDITGLGTMSTQNANAVAITGGTAALTGASSVTANSASAAFTVTQTGAGNAFVVEDSASDTTPFVVDTAGNVGIGTSSVTPIYGRTVQVGDGSTVSSISLIGTGATTTGDVYLASTGSEASLTARASTPLIFGAGDAERMRIDASGNVGIGAASPSLKLDVRGGSIVAGLGGMVLYGRLDAGFPSAAFNTGYFALGTNNTDASNGGLSIYTMAASTLSERMRITSGGNVGIGTTSPSAKLDVNGGVQVRANGNLLLLNSDNTNSYYIQNNGATGSGNAVFDVIQNGVGTRMRIDASGNVGIGATAPSSKLELRGASPQAITISHTNGTGYDTTLTATYSATKSFEILSGGFSAFSLRPTDGAAVIGAKLRVDRGASTPEIWLNGASGTDQVGFKAGTAGLGAMEFYTGAAERMRITSGGNVGIGVTPSAWVSTSKAVQLPGISLESTSATAGNIFANAYRDSSYVRRYVNTGTANQFDMSSSGFRWFNAPSGTAGDAVTFTQHMTLDASGNLGIGTTTGLTKKLNLASDATSAAATRMTNSANTLGFEVGLLAGDADASAYIYQRANSVMFFGTNNLTRMTIDNSGNVGIGATANTSSILDAQSTTKGVRFPNMTTTQKNAIANVAGNVVFDTTLGKLCVNTGAGWQTITSA